MKTFDELIWRSLIQRVRDKIKPDWLHCTLYHSQDLDRYLDSDNPVEKPITTIRQELTALGVKAFVRIPESANLTNYVEIDY